MAISAAPRQATHSFDAREVKRLNQLAYCDAGAIKRFVQSYRPYICPLEPLVEHIPPGSDVLDVGCGAGMMLLNLVAADRIRSGVGVDISATAIKAGRRAQERLAERFPDRRLGSLTFEARAAERMLDFQQLFDVVMIIDVLHHVPPRHQSAFLYAALNLVRPGGRIVYKDMCRRPFWRASMNRCHDLFMAFDWIHYFPIEEVRRLFSDGWTVVKDSSFSRLWYGHELIVAVKQGAS